jgi:hypothetical protein
MQRNYVPKCVREGKWSGHVVLKEISLDEYYDDVEKMTGEKEGERSTADNVKIMRERINACKPRLLEVKLKRLSDGREFKSFEDLTFGIDAHEILKEIALGFVTGFDDEGKSVAPLASK